MTNSTTIPENVQPLTAEMLSQLQRLASLDVVHRPATASTFSARVHAARRAVKRLEHEVALMSASPATAKTQSAILFELQANSRMLRSAAGILSDRAKIIARLPRAVLSTREEEPRIAAIAAAYLKSAGGAFSKQHFHDFIVAFQASDPLNLEELWNISGFLEFVLLESLLEDVRNCLRSRNEAFHVPISTALKSLRDIGHTDWPSFIEPLIVFDAILREDPERCYESMDFESRELYRKRVAFISSHSDCTESQVAQTALELAREAARSPTDDPRIRRRLIHNGYYLLDKGFPKLASRVGYHPPLIERMRDFIRAQADYFYINGIEIITLLFIAAFMLLPLSHFTLFDCVIAVLLLFSPCMQCAVDLVNNLVTSIFEPRPLPKLDFSKGIPQGCATLVAVPTLLINEKQVRTLVNELEVRFLANRDPNLHFVLLTDLPDSVAAPHNNDSHPLVDLVVRLISELNSKYDSMGNGAFILLHRRCIFNVRQGVWMGWERKRGKLLDLNKLLTTEFDAFPVKAGRLEALSQIRYVLTLDSDTYLPRGAAARLIGAIAHPLHQAVIHPMKRIVVEGYGILQPRIGVSVRSAARTRMAAIYSGQNGFDIYTRAISDAYQDLFGEGIFTGKGIYEVTTLHAVLDHRFPRNSLLSHDLIEGAYARAGLAMDIELIDDYPSHVSAYYRRKHRWVRGDWQIAQWMFSKVPDESARWGPSPISPVSRWQIFDNLRRSLVETFTFILFVAGWLGLPGGPLYWTIVSLTLLIFPTLAQLAFGLGLALLNGRKGSIADTLSNFWKAALGALFNLIFLPHQMLLSLDAILRALIRLFITGERLLEWETAAQAELQLANSTPADRYLVLAPIASLSSAGMVYFLNLRHHHALVVAAPILVLWTLAPIVTLWLNAPPRGEHRRLSANDENYLQRHALYIWRYFQQFGGEKHNYLIPDHVEEDGLFEAARVSPTNIGLLLNARQAACQLGFLTTPEFAVLTERSLASIARLEKYRGHLHNWYDTQTLQSLDDAPFVSTVDSGNLVASLYALRSGALALVQQSLLSRELFPGLHTHWQAMKSPGGLPASIKRVMVPAASASSADWIGWLSNIQGELPANEVSSRDQTNEIEWLNETQGRVRAILDMLLAYMPWLLPEYSALRQLPELGIQDDVYELTIEHATDLSELLEARLGNIEITHNDDWPLLALARGLREYLPAAGQNLRDLAAALRAIAQDAERLADETQFRFLAHPERQVLSLGYHVRTEELNDACYDLMASEARIATFLAIARDDLPLQSWIKLGRSHTRAFGSFLLLSWTGTMFEYLMPALWMRSYPNTLISRTLDACVGVQRAFANSLNIPWGISESGYSRTDDAGHYQYRAFGLPQVALSIEATAGPVVSPYSTFLALGIDSVAAIRNLRRMAKAGWVGAYGFYEAADFSAAEGKPVLVREWMAHHQGMALLAILNLLRDNAMQRWFHANPLVQATELLLQEMPMGRSMLKASIED